MGIRRPGAIDGLHERLTAGANVLAASSHDGPDGILMAVEPAASDLLEDNRNPISRLFYAGSIFVCTPSALAHGSDALGAQAGPSRLLEVLRSAGLSHARVAAQTPFNLLLEGRR